MIDRGEVGSLPTPVLANDLLYIDFVSMDDFNGCDYIMTCVDALTHFVQFWPCQKTLNGEGVIRLLLDRWISVYGKPNAIHSDNDVRMKSEKGFYQSVLKALGIQVHFSLPRRPQSNGLCENVNKQFVQI